MSDAKGDNKAVSDASRYEIQRAFDDLARFESDDEWTMTKIRRLLSSISPPDAFNEILKFVKYQDADMGADVRKMARRENLNTPEFREAFMDNVYGLMNSTLSTLDSFTRAAGMGVYPTNRVSGHPFRVMNSIFFTENLKAGSFGYVSGPRGQALGVGKTDFSCKMMEMLTEDPNVVVATNILIDPLPPNIVRVWGLRDLVELAIKNLFDGKRTIAILDEFLQFVSKEKATKSDWVNLKQLMYLFRKLGITLLALSQREIEVPTAIQDMASWHVQKLDKFTLDIRQRNSIDRIFEVPGTKLPFETEHPGSFDISDLKVPEMHEFLVEREREAARTGEKVNAFAVILEFLNHDESTISKRDLQGFAKVAYCYMHLTQAEIAEVCSIGSRSFTQQAISYWLEGMKQASV